MRTNTAVWGSWGDVLLVLAWLFWLPSDGSMSAAEPRAIPVSDWETAYTKAGGETQFNPDHPTRLAILKTSTPLKIAVIPNDVRPQGVRTVVLGGDRITDADVAIICKWPGIEAIELADCSLVTDVGIQAIAACAELRHVTLGETKMTSRGLSAFSSHQRLESLVISTTGSQPSVVDCIDLDGLPKLKLIALACERAVSLRIADCPRLTDITGAHSRLETVVLERLPALGELDLSNTNTHKITLAGVDALKRVDLSRTSLDSGAVKKLTTALPHVAFKVSLPKRTGK
jgi:hypothetical protein